MTQPAAYYPDGTPIPAEEWESAVSSGQARWSQGESIKAYDPTGQKVVIPPEDYQRALAAGYRIASPDDVARSEAERRHGSSAGQLGLTAAEAAARGLTFGVSDAFIAGFGGPEAAEAAAGRRLANPSLATAGEITGAVAPILMSGGTGALAKGAATVGAAPVAVARVGTAAERAALALVRREGQGALGRIGARALGTAAGAAAEGALYGVGQAISDSALSNTELTAEKILSSAGHGALWGGLVGGALGGGIGAVGEGVKLARRGAETVATPIRERLRAFGEERAFKQLIGNNKRLYERAQGRGGMANVQRLGRKALDRKIPLANIDDAAKAVNAELNAAGKRLEGVAHKLDEAGQRIAGAELLAKIDEQIAGFRGHNLGDFRKVAKKLEQQVAPLRELLEGAPPPRLKGKGGDLLVDPITGKAPRPANEVGTDLLFSEFWKVRRDLDQTINWAAKKQSPATDAMKDLRRTFEDGLFDAIEKAERAGVSDDLTKGWRAAKEDYADFALLRDGIEDQVTRRESNRFFSPTDYGLGGAALPMATALMGGSGLLTASMGVAGAAAHKLVRERGNAVAAQLLDRVTRFDGRFESAAQALAGLRKVEPTRLVVPASIPLRERFDQARTQVEQLGDPQQAVTMLAANTADIATTRPDVAAAVQERVLGDAEYLRSQLPPMLSRSSASLTPQAETTRVPLTAMRAWMRKVDAIADPMRVVEDLAQGKVDRDGIEAIKVRRPKLFDALRQQVMIYTHQRSEELPYKQRILLSLTFDFVGDRSMQPGTLQQIQASHGAAESEPGAQGSGASIDPRVAESMATPSQKAGV